MGSLATPDETINIQSIGHVYGMKFWNNSHLLSLKYALHYLYSIFDMRGTLSERLQEQATIISPGQIVGAFAKTVGILAITITIRFMFGRIAGNSIYNVHCTFGPLGLHIIIYRKVIRC